MGASHGRNGHVYHLMGPGTGRPADLHRIVLPDRSSGVLPLLRLHGTAGQNLLPEPLLFRDDLLLPADPGTGKPVLLPGYTAQAFAPRNTSACLDDPAVQIPALYRLLLRGAVQADPGLADRCDATQDLAACKIVHPTDRAAAAL